MNTVPHIDLGGIRCVGSNGCTLFRWALHPAFPRLMEEVKQLVTDWEASAPRQRKHYLHIGFKCKAGRHRSYANMSMAAYCLRRLGFIVFTEAPDAQRLTDRRFTQCLCPDLCPCYGMDRTLHQKWENDAEVAAAVALRSFTDSLCILSGPSY